MVATLNQPQYQPWPVEEQVVGVWVAPNGYLDDIPVEDVPRFNEELRHAPARRPDVLEAIRTSGDAGATRPSRRCARRRGVQAGLRGARRRAVAGEA